MAFECMIFDMDGVIIDSEGFCLTVNDRIIRENGIILTREDYERFIGMSNSDMWEILKKEYNLDQSIEFFNNLQTKRTIEYLSQIEISPIDGIIDLLEFLKKNNIRMAVASSSPMEYINAVIEKFGIREYFEILVSGEEFEKSKPNPDIYIHTAVKMGADKNETFVIEDSYNGSKAAFDAGIDCIGFQNINSGNQDLSLCIKVFDKISAIQSFLSTLV